MGASSGKNANALQESRGKDGRSNFRCSPAAPPRVPDLMRSSTELESFPLLLGTKLTLQH
ncbi:hypothetical protein RvY_14038 [Ramazzottius varieornatus]|uniref:Uncharacterized protein n=1 Tax=Ramazzottius varieornatus TaxID=947166 RepID=A0A1D1VTU6_RAMVA|nr:hypothetical protein RvY_14038 [Ramazzottius varieornatus]